MNAAWLAGLMQSRPSGMPRMRAISGVIFAAGSTPPRPGFAPCESLISIARTFAERDRLSSEALERELAAVVAAAEVAGADLPDDVAALAVVVGDAAFAGVLQRAARARRRG